MTPAADLDFLRR